MASINSPFIVRLHSSFQTTDKLVLVMDYCNGGNLEHHIVREGKFSEEEALFYIPEIVLALEELHKHDIIFRDLKPENVVLDSEGHAKLTDFGLAKMNMRRGQLTQSFCGSVAYMAPEVLKRQGHDKAVDWYCLGAMLYEMLTGSPPHFANTRNKIKENILNNAVQIPENLSPACRDLLQRVITN
jgi:protein-serine/threonine kinase